MFIFGGQSRTSQGSLSQISLASDTTPRSTPSSARFKFGDGNDPDMPLPSIETDASVSTTRNNTPSTTLYTPSVSTQGRQIRNQDSLLENFGNLNIVSPPAQESSSSWLGSPTPSIQFTPPAPANETIPPRSNRTDSLVGGVRALQLQPSSPPESRGASAERDTRSPSASRRRRSGQRVNEDKHQVENEEPPRASFYTRESQEALRDARRLTASIVDVLSTSNLHREDGSTVHKLHQQAVKLNEFQLPSSRIVGLVGDSGVGKSSLINSLLDKADLARAVSSHQQNKLFIN